MPRRRDTVCQQATAAVVEFLENRMLLTTMVGGGVDFLGNPIVNTYRYFDSHNHRAEIAVGGNTTIEAIFGHAIGFNVTLGDLVPPPPPNVPPPFGSDLFQIYVAQADQSSFVSVYEFDPDDGTPLPFNGTAGNFRVTNALNGRSITVTPDGGTGQLVLGTRSQSRQGVTLGNNQNDIPITSVAFSGPFGARPDLGQTRIVAGLQVADGVDIGRFLFGGTVIGAIVAGGSVEQMYVGNLWTGASAGAPLGGDPLARRTPNFLVRGDLHSLLVGGSIGTNTDANPAHRPTYETDFDGQVLGRVGQIAVRDSFVGGFDAVNNPVTQPFGANVFEVEGVGLDDGANDTNGWSEGRLSGSGIIRNDTFDTPQILPSYPGRKGRSNVIANGQLEADPNAGIDYRDYYGVGLIAGQSLTVQLSLLGGIPTLGFINVGIFDPDGRLIATDYPNVDATAVTGAPIRITADRPGLYRIAVATIGDRGFDGPGGEGVVTNSGEVPYELSISEAGNIGLGGIITGGNLFDAQLVLGAYGFFCENGDLGALEVGGSFLSEGDSTVVVRKGSLRSVTGATIGTAVSGNPHSPNLIVPRGSVGLVSSDGLMALNEPSPLVPPVGGDYQVVSAGGTMVANLVANRRIGVIRADNMATLTPSTFTVNADEIGNDGIIDLIDVPNQFGTLAGGGPAITTGTGGNVRYMHVAYNPGAGIFRDFFFGGGSPEATIYQPGVDVPPLFDDSGTRIEIESFPLTPNPLFTPGGTNPAFLGPTITVTGYGIRGSGGQAIVNVTTTGSVRIGAGGGNGSASHAEIGTIVSNGQGNPVIRSTNNGALAFAFPQQATPGNTSAANLDIIMDGSGRLDVWDIRGSDFTGIINNTPGEIVNIDSTVNPILLPLGITNNGTIGTLRANSIGIAQNYTGAALNPLGVAAGGNTFPFLQQHTQIVSGNILNIQSNGAVGNLFVTGSIGNITANRDGRNRSGTFEGIAAPVYTTDRLDAVQIGQGIAPSGSGNVSRAGLYALGGIGVVANQGLGSDVRGTIYSGSTIGSINLRDGAFISSTVMIATEPQMTRVIAPLIVIPTLIQPINNPRFDIGQVNVSGIGGIIGSQFTGNALGPISSKGGFGIINSLFTSNGSGTFNNITAEGYGIRDTRIIGGASVGSINANAKGRNVSVRAFSPSVRQSERVAIDPFFGQAPNRETDLHAFFGTTFHTPQIRGVTETGMIDGLDARASRELGSIYGVTIQNSALAFANNIGRIRAKSDINALTITTGRLRSYLGGHDGSALQFTVAGPIDDFHQVGNIDSTSTIRATGGSGRIGNFVVDGDINGDVSSSNAWHLLQVFGDVGATSFIQTRLPFDIRDIRGNIFGTIKIGS